MPVSGSCPSLLTQQRNQQIVSWTGWKGVISKRKASGIISKIKKNYAQRPKACLAYVCTMLRYQAWPISTDSRMSNAGRFEMLARYAIYGQLIRVPSAHTA